MCGIAGLVSDLAPQERQRRLAALAESLAHRGPDDSRCWSDPVAGVGFAHRRLSVIDLSPLGAQPMASASGRYTLCFNGEIYDFRSLKARLLDRGHRFRGGSDTEVLLAACEEWGSRGALERCDGMFALALWDAERGLLQLARDRLGEKPLYCGFIGGGGRGRSFAFASELKALATLPDWQPSLERRAIELYFRYGYVPDPWSIYRGIGKLPPACLLSLPVEGGRAAAAPRLERYWHPLAAADGSVAEPFRGSPEAAVERLEELLAAAVAERMISDVPLGAFLSGGIDSSLVVALMQRCSSDPVKTFTIAFPGEDGFDEAPHARAVARQLGTDHRELAVSAEDALALVPRLPGLYDEPFADSSQLPTYLVAEMARQRVTVCLSGDGGDELFGGYLRYRLAGDLWRRLAPLPRPLRRLGSGLLAATPAPLAGLLAAPLARRAARYGRPGRAGDKLARLAPLLPAADPDDLYRRLVSHWGAAPPVLGGGGDDGSGYAPLPFAPDEAFAGLGLTTGDGDPVAAPFAAASSNGSAGGLTPERRMMLRDLATYLPGDILVKVDRAAMAVSLETRLPLLDPEVVAFSLSLPTDILRHDGRGKWPVRRLLSEFLPAASLGRPKRGFAVPLAEWLRGPLAGWGEELLAPERLRDQGYLDVRRIRRCWREHQQGRRDWRYELWDALVFQSWLERWEPAAESG